MKNKLTQPLKWHGGKHYLADWIISMMPPHVHYVEPYFGGGAVLLNKDPNGVSEVANDINSELTNFWEVLRVDVKRQKMMEALRLTPFSEEAWRAAGKVTSDDAVDQAVAFFVRCRQSRAGKMDSFATVTKNRTRRGMNEQVSAWMGAVDGLEAVAARLERVLILNSPAVKVIKQQDGPNTLFYLDPPYLHDTRVTTSDYAHEMSEEDHEELLDAIVMCQGRVMLSGYPSELYDAKLSQWERVEREIDNKASSAKVKPKKREVLWANFRLTK